MGSIRDIDEMIRLRSTRVPSINQMQGWKAEIEQLRAALEAVDSEVVLEGQLKELVDAALAADHQQTAAKE